MKGKASLAANRAHARRPGASEGGSCVCVYWRQAQCNPFLGLFFQGGVSVRALKKHGVEILNIL